MLPAYVRNYQFAALRGTPDVLDRLLRGTNSASSVWDATPDPARFTLREMLAHIADWEPIFLDRLKRTVELDEPVLQGYDEGQIALERDYAHSEPLMNLQRFREGRETLVDYLQSLPDSAWDRVGRHTELGPITLEGLLSLIVGHDGYHTAQVVQWLSASED